MKQGRLVRALRFEIKRNPAKMTEENGANLHFSGLSDQVLELLAGYGIAPDAELTQILEKHSFETIESVCQKADQIFAEKKRVGQPIAGESGYLLALLKNPATFKAAQTKNAKRA